MRLGTPPGLRSRDNRLASPAVIPTIDVWKFAMRPVLRAEPGGFSYSRQSGAMCAEQRIDYEAACRGVIKWADFL
jgi:hypothetical protein